LRKKLVGQKITTIDRVGKLLIFYLSDDSYLLIHLKMTGQLVYWDQKKLVAGGHKLSDSDLHLPNKHTHLEINFCNKSVLYFSDLRKFGYVRLVDKKVRDVAVSKFGVNPLDKEFTLKKFQELLKNRKTVLKAFLLNQQLIAGLGNIYVDEVCFKAGVKPNRRLNDLKPEEIKKIYQSIKPILHQAIKYGGTTFRNYLNHDGQQGNYTQFLQVYGRAGEKCKRCDNKIIKIKVAGRGTHYCPKCQK